MTGEATTKGESFAIIDFADVTTIYRASSYTCINNHKMSLAKVYQSLKQMRKLTEANVPFSFSFQPYSEQKKTTGTVRTINKALLRPGLTAKQSSKNDILIAYYDLEKKREGFAYLPLILTFNGIELKK